MDCGSPNWVLAVGDNGTALGADDGLLDDENFELMLDNQELRREGEAFMTLVDSFDPEELLNTFSELPWLRRWGRWKELFDGELDKEGCNPFVVGGADRVLL